jgi:hypothetical protein
MYAVLDVGCGSYKIPNSVGMDQFNLPNVDIIHDLNIIPWPIPSESYHKIVFSHSISHLQDIVPIMNECHRILKKGGQIEIVAPHFSSDNYNTDPTHNITLGYRSMNYFVKNVPFKYRYLDSQKLFLLVNRSISFREYPASWRKTIKFNPLYYLGLESLVNYFPRLYEKHLCWLFPASEIYFLLEKI